MTANVRLIICNSLEHPQTDAKVYKGILKCRYWYHQQQQAVGGIQMSMQERRENCRVFCITRVFWNIKCCYLPWMQYKNYRNCAAVEFPDCYWLKLLSDKGGEDCVTQTPHQSLYANSKIQGLAHLPLLNLQSFIVTKLFHFWKMNPDTWCNSICQTI